MRSVTVSLTPCLSDGQRRRGHSESIHANKRRRTGRRNKAQPTNGGAYSEGCPTGCSRWVWTWHRGAWLRRPGDITNTAPHMCERARLSPAMRPIPALTKEKGSTTPANTRKRIDHLKSQRNTQSGGGVTLGISRGADNEWVYLTIHVDVEPAATRAQPVLLLVEDVVPGGGQAARSSPSADSSPPTRRSVTGNLSQLLMLSRFLCCRSIL
eukprot:COSAG01_NODE_5332_length_4329_cov_4505.447991_3_plen_211_part_00